MKCLLLFMAVSIAAFGIEPQAKVPAGSKIYVQAEDGFDTYLIAALQKKKVPVTVVTNKEQADYEIDGVSDHQKAGWAKVILAGDFHSDDQASIKMVNLKSGEVVFAYAVNKKSTLHGRQTAAEACAKHLKEAVETKK